MISNLRPYPAYKDSGVPWLGQVPEHWEVIQVKRAYNIQLGKMLQNVPSSPEDILVPYFKALHVQWSGVILKNLPTMWASPRDLNQYGVCIGDLLVCEGGEGGRCAIVNQVDSRAIIQNALHRVRPRGQSSNKFLQLTLRTIASTGWFEALNDKATIAHFTREKFAALQIALPPLPEQTAIVRFLDSMDRRIRRSIRGKQKLIKLLEEYKQALIHQAVTGQIDVRTGQPYPAYKDSGVEWLGKVPAHWELRRLRDSIAGCINGIWGDEANGVYDIVCIRVADFEYAKFGVSLRNLTMRSIIPSKRIGRMLSPGDLLLEKSGGGAQQPVGRIVRFDHDIDAVCSNFIARIVPGDGYNRDYLVYLHAMLYAIGLNVRSIKQTTGIQNLDSRMYFNETVAFPPLPEQTAIAEYLDAQTAKIDAAIAAARREIELLREYRERLVSDVVTGKVDVREVASRLPEESEEPDLPEEEINSVTDESEEVNETMSADEETED